jgi:aldehyde dehydrogenase (NAD+)
VDKVGFTGSSEVGKKIGELCGRHMQSPCLELGGKNPLVVMPDANLDLAVEGALFSGFGTAGQRCTSLGTVVVHESIHDEFLKKFARAVEEAPIGDPTEDVLYGPMLSERFHERFVGWLISSRSTIPSTVLPARGASPADNPREGFVGEHPEAASTTTRLIVSGVTMEDETTTPRLGFGPIVSRGCLAFSRRFDVRLWALAIIRCTG